MIAWIIFFALLGGLVALLVAYRNTLVRWYEKTVAFLKEVRVEMQKVVWPNRQEVYGATFVVLVSVLILTIAIGVEDRLLSEVLERILSLAVR